MRIYGHRGARGERPENTIAGFLHAKAAGAAGVETDIALSADLVPVLHHDPHLPDGRLIRDLAVADLPELPTLAAALAAVPAIDWLLEIKTFPDVPETSHPPAVVVNAVAAVLRGAEVPAERILILAFEWLVLRKFAALAPAYRRVCLTAPRQEAARDLWWGAGYDGLSTPAAVARHGAYAWAPNCKTVTPPAIVEARNLRLHVIPWTVNEAVDFRRLAPLVDGLITDYPARAG